MRKLVPTDSRLIPEDAVPVFHGRLFDVYHWQQKLFNGDETTFEMLKRPDSVVVVGVNDSKLVIIDEQQPGENWKIRFPGGRVNPGETWLDAAKREMLEETGMEFRTWKMVDVRQPYSKMEWFVATFVATEHIHTGSKSVDPGGERVKIRAFEFNIARQQIMSDQTGYLHFTKDFFGPLRSTHDLINVPDYKGKIIDR